VRTCVGCRRRAPQPELERVVATSGGGLAPGRNLPGRGAWLCRGSVACMQEALRKGSLARALRTTLDPDAGAALCRGIGACGRM